MVPPGTITVPEGHGLEFAEQRLGVYWLPPDSLPNVLIPTAQGVWMGSDSSTDSISGCDKRVQTLSFQDFAMKRAPAIAPPAKARSPEEIAAELVFKCVEASQETIDLSYVLCPFPA